MCTVCQKLLKAPTEFSSIFIFIKQIRIHYNFIYNWFLDIASYFKKISDNDISGEKPEHFIDACWQQHL